MKILVIGNGFLGASIIQRLESEGHELLIFSKTLKESTQSRQMVGNIFDFDSFANALLWNPQIILQTAWTTAHGLYTTDPSNYKYARFTSDLAKYIVRSDVEHLIILGTCAEYGTQSVASTAGITKIKPDNLYAKQKIVAFNSVKETILGSTARLTWARIFQPYGPNQDKKRLLPYLIDSLREGNRVALNDTSSILDWITTRDIASAISWIIQNDTPIEVDVGTSFGYTNVELLQHLETLLGHSDQWARISSQPSFGNKVAIVGKGSPLFISGWNPCDSLDVGLEWVLGS